jgi:hypothetical protein
MEKIIIDQVSVFESTEGIYISRGDHSLVNVKGKDASMVLNVIKEFKESDSSDDVFQLLREKYGIDESYYNKILNWLMKNRVLTTGGKTDAKTRHFTIIGQFGGEEELVNKLFSRLNANDDNEHYALLQYIDLKKPFDEAAFNFETDAVLYFSPIFDNYETFKQINRTLYKNKINCLHIGIDEFSYTIGPFIIPSVSTPCLKCYSQRKLVNMGNPDEYVKFTAIQSIDKITSYSITDIRHFNLLAEHIKIALDDFFILGKSDLIGKSVLVDLYDYNTQVSKVLKVPTCEVCSSSENIYTPFN